MSLMDSQISNSNLEFSIFSQYKHKQTITTRTPCRVPELQQSELVCKFLCDINDDKIFQAENFGDHAGRMMRNIHKSILTDRCVARESILYVYVFI